MVQIISMVKRTHNFLRRKTEAGREEGVVLSEEREGETDRQRERHSQGEEIEKKTQKER